MNPLIKHKHLRTAAVQTLPNGDIAISKVQRNVHVTSEAVAVFVVAPLTAYIAYSTPMMQPWAKTFLYTVAAGTLIIDGGLLFSYSRERKQ